MIQTEQRKLVVADPGLEHLSGHHAAVLDLMPAASNDEIGLNIEVWLNIKANREVESYAEARGFKVNRFFQSSFYSYMFRPARLSEVNEDVRQLTDEYLTILLAFQNDKSATIFFHTMDWYHLWALSLAVEQALSKTKKLPEMLVLLMFNPLARIGKEYSAPIYGAACRKLLSQKIKMFASDFETSQEVSNLLDIAPLPIHPCLITGEKKEQREARSQEKANSVLLYCGDAKANKGFNQLPELLERIVLNDSNTLREYVIHYTNNSLDPELVATESRLERIASSFPKLRLVKGFVSQFELEGLISSSNSMVMNYDPAIYQHKSSGLVWLAAKYNTPLICLTDTWNNREASRLETNCIVTSISQLQQYLEYVFDNEHSPNRYYQKLFRSFPGWLKQQLK